MYQTTRLHLAFSCGDWSEGNLPKTATEHLGGWWINYPDAPFVELIYLHLIYCSILCFCNSCGSFKFTTCHSPSFRNLGQLVTTDSGVHIILRVEWSPTPCGKPPWVPTAPYRGKSPSQRVVPKRHMENQPGQIVNNSSRDHPKMWWKVYKGIPPKKSQKNFIQV